MKKTDIPTVPVFKFYKNALRILKNPLDFHRENFDELGDTFRLKIGPGDPVVFSRDPGFAKYVLQKNHKNYTKTTIQTRDVAKYLGKGLLTSEGEHWKKQRKLIQPAFHKQQLIHILGSLNSAIHTELNKIEEDKPIDIFPVFNDLAFQTVVKSLFSSAVGEKEMSRLQYITEAAQKMLVKELRQPYLSNWFLRKRNIQKHIGLTQEARIMLKKIIDERRLAGKKDNDLLDMLLDARYDDGSGMDNEQLIDEILILFTAGHETTSNALTFTAQLLARNPEVQEKIFVEARKAKIETNSLIEFIQACDYIKQVVEESMRLYPPAYFIDRVNIDEDEYEDKVIPPNTSLLFSMYEIHRHKNFWEEPEKFIPERFSKTKKYSSAYYPFGAGPRMCIGNNFAMYEMILAVSELVDRYKISSNGDEIKIKPLITLKPKNSVLKFERRY